MELTGEFDDEKRRPMKRWIRGRRGGMERLGVFNDLRHSEAGFGQERKISQGRACRGNWGECIDSFAAMKHPRDERTRRKGRQSQL